MLAEICQNLERSVGLHRSAMIKWDWYNSLWRQIQKLGKIDLAIWITVSNLHNFNKYNWQFWYKHLTIWKHSLQFWQIYLAFETNLRQTFASVFYFTKINQKSQSLVFIHYKELLSELVMELSLKSNYTMPSPSLHLTLSCRSFDFLDCY